jgi:hypothetical protein
VESDLEADNDDDGLVANSSGKKGKKGSKKRAAQDDEGKISTQYLNFFLLNLKAKNCDISRYCSDFVS